MAVGQVDGFCDERFKDVERLFANQRLAQLCVFVDGKMVVSIINIYPSHGYTALVANQMCKKYQAILACWSSLGTYRCMQILYGPRDV